MRFATLSLLALLVAAACSSEVSDATATGGEASSSQVGAGGGEAACAGACSPTEVCVALHPGPSGRGASTRHACRSDPCAPLPLQCDCAARVCEAELETPQCRVDEALTVHCGDEPP